MTVFQATINITTLYKYMSSYTHPSLLSNHNSHCRHELDSQEVSVTLKLSGPSTNRYPQGPPAETLQTEYERSAALQFLGNRQGKGAGGL